MACAPAGKPDAAAAFVLRSRRRVRSRRLLLELLDDLAEGACSVLEREYLLLEQRHGLPRAERQPREMIAARPFYRDVRYSRYSRYRVMVELDGRPSTTPRERGIATTRATSTRSSTPSR